MTKYRSISTDSLCQPGQRNALWCASTRAKAPRLQNTSRPLLRQRDEAVCHRADGETSPHPHLNGWKISMVTLSGLLPATCPALSAARPHVTLRDAGSKAKDAMPPEHLNTPATTKPPPLHSSPDYSTLQQTTRAKIQVPPAITWSSSGGRGLKSLPVLFMHAAVARVPMCQVGRQLRSHLLHSAPVWPRSLPKTPLVTPEGSGCYVSCLRFWAGDERALSHISEPSTVATRTWQPAHICLIAGNYIVGIHSMVNQACRIAGGSSWLIKACLARVRVVVSSECCWRVMPSTIGGGRSSEEHQGVDPRIFWKLWRGGCMRHSSCMKA